MVGDVRRIVAWMSPAVRARFVRGSAGVVQVRTGSPYSENATLNGRKESHHNIVEEFPALFPCRESRHEAEIVLFEPSLDTTLPCWDDPHLRAGH